MKYIYLALEWIPIVWLGVTALTILAIGIFGGEIKIKIGNP